MGVIFELVLLVGIVWVVNKVINALHNRSTPLGKAVAWLYENGILESERPARDVSSADSTESVTTRLRKSGVEVIEMIVGIDFTESNVDQGAKTNGGRSLHDVSLGADAVGGPYQRALHTIARTLLPLDHNKSVPMYKFGDARTGGESIELMGPGEVNCSAGPDALLRRYVETASKIVPPEEATDDDRSGKTGQIVLSGPTNYGPLIDAAAKQAIQAKAFTVLVILTDGLYSPQCRDWTISSIVRASRAAPLSIIIVGMGDGPWDMMHQLDNDLRAFGQYFDNVHFIEYSRAIAHGDRHFAELALAELPKQYAKMVDLGLFNRSDSPPPAAAAASSTPRRRRY